jgi:hypothetical protein
MQTQRYLKDRNGVTKQLPNPDVFLILRRETLSKTVRCLQEGGDESTGTDKGASDSTHSRSSASRRGPRAGGDGRAVGIGGYRVRRAGAGGLASRRSGLSNEEGRAVVGRDGQSRGAVVGVSDGDGVDASSDGGNGHEQWLRSDLVRLARHSSGLAGHDGGLAGDGGLASDDAARISLGGEGGLRSWVDGARGRLQRRVLATARWNKMIWRQNLRPTEQTQQP